MPFGLLKNTGLPAWSALKTKLPVIIDSAKKLNIFRARFSDAFTSNYRTYFM